MLHTRVYLLPVWIVMATLTVGPAAGAETSPPNLCAEDYCSPPMQSIYDEFSRLQTAPAAADRAQVFSGECYNDGYFSDPSQPSYGLTLLDPKGSDVQFGTIFTFGPTTNPHSSLDVSQARKTLRSSGSNPRVVSQQADLFNVEYGSDSTSIRYWMRLNPETGDLLLVNLGTYGDYGRSRIFCRLKPH
ncbi:MAG: hypothetical protein AB7G93_14760 [Bdellovibrionales bacterium]